MNIYEKPDGRIEFGLSGCCCPPGERHSGQHTNCATEWVRVNGGTWQRSVRNHHRILAGAAETCAEFEEALKKQPDPFGDVPGRLGFLLRNLP